MTPRVSSQALFWLDRIEIETGIRLPGAVRELYSTPAEIDRLRSSMPPLVDILHAPQNLLILSHIAGRRSPISLMSNGSGCYFDVPMSSENDDPPVSAVLDDYIGPIYVDAGYRSVTELVYLIVWEFTGGRYTWDYKGGHNLFTAETLTTLDGLLTHHSSTISPNYDTVHRFTYNDARIVVHVSEELRSKGTHRWHIQSDSSTAAQNLMIRLKKHMPHFRPQPVDMNSWR